MVVITGRDRGKQGEVLRVLRKEDRLIVQGVNMVKRHQRPAAGHPGGIIDKEASIHISNVAHVDPDQRQADPGRLQDARRRPQGALRQALRRDHRPVGEPADGPAAGALSGGRARRAAGALRLPQPDAVPKLDKIVLNMGVGEATAGRRRSCRPRSAR